MKFAIVTKHAHLIFTYREPESEDHKVVSNTGGSFDVVGVEQDVDVAGEDGEMHFGFARG